MVIPVTAPRPLPRPAPVIRTAVAASVVDACPDQVNLSAVAPARLKLANPASAVAAAVPGPSGVGVWLTTVDEKHLLEAQPTLPWNKGAQTPANDEVRVDPSIRYQEMDGFGASFTDSSAYLLQQKLSPPQRSEVMKKLFSQEGINLSLIRQPIGSCDYNLDVHSLNDQTGDVEQKAFTIARDRENMLPCVKEALALQPGLKVIATPWSPPGWMKTSGTMLAGQLKPEMYRSYGQYLANYVKSYQAEGVPIYALTMQNEPLFEPNHYPSCLMPADQEAAFLKEGLGPVFREEGLKTRVLLYDHNWDRKDYPLDILKDPEASQYVAGVAWHGYGGSHEAMSEVHDAYPDKGQWFTESSGGEWIPGFHDAYMDEMKHVIRCPRNWSKSVVWWNMALDKDHGPSLLGKDSTCRGLLTVDQATGAVDYNLDYYTMGHISKFVQPGAVRIDSNQTQDQLENVAFQNPDGSKVLIAQNRTHASRTLTVREGERSFTYTLPGEASATFCWDRP